jgi:Uma2 family endonuclease
MSSTLPRSPSAEPKPLPPLQNGDRMTRFEFERRYAAMPPHVKAELIEGVVYIMPSPVSQGFHGGPQSTSSWWLVSYVLATPGVECGSDSTVRLDLDNEPQPDGVLFILPTHGGRIRLDENLFIEGTPELAFEVSASSVSYDLHGKLNVYRRNGIQEYVVWRVLDHEVDWFVVREGQYVKKKSDQDGILRSEVFPGLWLHPAALVSKDLVRVDQVLRQGIASPEHAAFVAELAKRAAGAK